jgi:hypothetical protein
MPHWGCLRFIFTVARFYRQVFRPLATAEIRSAVDLSSEQPLSIGNTCDMNPFVYYGEPSL